MNVAFDSNVLVYAERYGDEAREWTARALIGALPGIRTFIPLQVLGELFNVLVRKARRDPELVHRRIAAYADAANVIETSGAAFFRASSLAAQHRLQIWDAVIVATAEQAGCRILLSEDMQDGFTWGGLTVVNPFLDKPNPLLSMAVGPLPAR